MRLCGDFGVDDEHLADRFLIEIIISNQYCNTIVESIKNKLNTHNVEHKEISKAYTVAKGSVFDKIKSIFRK